MKKLLVFLLIAMMSLSLVACLQTDEPEGEVKIGTPVIVLNADNSVTWQSVENATAYVVEINGVEQQTQTETVFPAQTGVGEYSIKVKGVNGENSGEWSNVVSYEIKEPEPTLDVPVITLNSDKSVTWSAIDGATHYVVEINGVEQSQTISETSYPAIIEEGEYTIRVKAVGEIESGWSNSVKYTVEIPLVLKELTSPVSLLRESQQNYVNRPVGDSSIITEYANGAINVSPNVSLEWTCTYENASFTVEVSTDENFGNIVYSQVTQKDYVRVRNLYKNTKYFWRVTMTVEGEQNYVQTSQFTTANSGPRVVSVEGVLNTRDIGGYVTQSGKTTLQGMLYRGSEMDSAYVITENGVKTMVEEFGIKSDMDLRGALVAESPLGSNINYAPFAIANYLNAFSAPTQTELYRQVFSFMANKDNYPIYFHCQGGADRTGTVAFLLNGLLGVSFADLVHDQEFTSFSSVGVREFFGTEGLVMQPVYEKLMNDYEGDTLSEKIENYMLSIGVTETEIYNIKAIMFGEETRELPVTLSVPTSINVAKDTILEISVNDLGTKSVSKVFINGNEVNFNYENGKISVAITEFSSVADGKVSGEVVLSDDTQLDFSFEKQNVQIKLLSDYIAEETLLNSSTTSVTSAQALGYESILRGVLLSTHNGVSGGLGISIGSYGVYLRGGSFRIYYNDAEKARDLAQMVSTINVFEEGDTAFELRVEIVSQSVVRIHIKTELIQGGTNGKHMSGTYEMTRDLQTEISSENAKVKLWISVGDVPTLQVKQDGGTGANLDVPSNPDVNIPEEGTTVMLSDYIEEGTVLNSNVQAINSTNIVGYGAKIKGLLKSEGAGATGGGIIMSIGSYGFQLRGGELRIMQNGSEIARNTGLALSSDVFNNGDMYFELWVEIVNDNTAKLTLQTYKVDGSASEHSVIRAYEFTRTNEIACSDAIFALSIRTDGLTSLTVLSEDVKNQEDENQIKTVMLSDYIEAGTVLNAENLSVTSTKAVGYDVVLKCLYTTDGLTETSSGGTYIYVGSYGIYLRGGIRGYLNGTEVRGIVSGGLRVDAFDNGQYYLELGIKIKDESTVTMTLKTYGVTEDNPDFCVEYTWEFSRANEIDSENATVTIAIRSDEVTSLTILSENG